MRFLLLLCAFWVSEAAFAQLTITLTNVPANTPSGATLYVAGNFNTWNPGAAAYSLIKQTDGTYTITLPTTVRGAVEFKITKGTWAAEECQANGSSLSNRRFTIPATGAATFTGTVAAWKDSFAPASTATASVSIMSTSFAIPQLNRARRIWLYLPPDYATSTKRYPVLYMHDGQNLFDNATAFSGEWGVDEALDQLQAQGDYGCIVVGVDNGGASRTSEYTPYANALYGGGQGNAYVDFLSNTLKPYIDQNYRTKTDRLHTGIMGSSLGGLISLYGGIKKPEVFGRIGVFSPAFWINPEIYGYAGQQKTRAPDPKMYIVSGRRESTNLLKEVGRMVDTLTNNGWILDQDLDTLSKADGQHAEWFWRREFPAAYKWLFAATPTNTLPRGNAPALELFPNPGLDSQGMVTIRYADTKIHVIEVVDAQGKVVAKTKLKHGQAQFYGSNLPAGRYGIRLVLPQGVAYRAWVKG